MVWQKRFLVTVSITAKRGSDQSLINSLSREFMDQIRAKTIKERGVFLRVTEVERLNDPQAESHKKRVRTFVEKFK
jgi:hypothetical protein